MTKFSTRNMDYSTIPKISQDYMYVGQTVNGKFFAVKNIRQTFSGDTMTLTADFTGPGGEEYIKRLGDYLISHAEDERYKID